MIVFLLGYYLKAQFGCIVVCTLMLWYYVDTSCSVCVCVSSIYMFCGGAWIQGILSPKF